jgi:hypothetical protein
MQISEISASNGKIRPSRGPWKENAGGADASSAITEKNRHDLTEAKIEL